MFHSVSTVLIATKLLDTSKLDYFWVDYSTDILHAMPSGQATCAEQGHPHCISVMTCPQAESRLCLLKLHSLSVKYHIQLIRLGRPPTYITRDSEGSSYFKDTMAAHNLQNTLRLQHWPVRSFLTTAVHCLTKLHLPFTRLPPLMV